MRGTSYTWYAGIYPIDPHNIPFTLADLVNLFVSTVDQTSVILSHVGEDGAIVEHQSTNCNNSWFACVCSVSQLNCGSHPPTSNHTKASK